MNFDSFTPAQRACVQHLDGPLFVAAGAGSGKTFTLQQRIAYALLPESGPALTSIDEVLAITFMEKAAAEIKARVRAVLREEGKFEEALKVDGAWISTIHGMSSRILRENALEVGIDPQFSVLSEFEETRLRARAVEEVLRAEADGQRFAAMFAEYGARAGGRRGVSVQGMLKTLLDKASSYRAGLDAVDFGDASLDVSSVANEVLRVYERAQQLIESVLGPKAGVRQLKTQQSCVQACEALGAFVQEDSHDAEQLAHLLAQCELLRKDGFGKVAGLEGEEVAAAVKQKMDWAFRSLNLAQGHAYVQPLMALAREAEAVYQRHLDAQGALDNDGLLRRTLEALEANPSLAQQYQSRFKLVMVDEFQDTNQMQVDLISLVAGTDKLCTVGDAQQSIYRFNGADVSVFNQQRSIIEALDDKACLAQLDDNFRSHSDILAFVRCVCAQDQVFGKEFLDLRASREDKGPFKGPGPRVEVQLVTYEGSKEASGVLQVEAQGIARRFAALRATDDHEGYQPSQMVLLLSTLTNVDTYAAALRAEGFAVVVNGGRSFFELPEVKTVEHLLTALANPADTRALYAVLTSELLQLSPDDFVRLSTVQDEISGQIRRQSIDRGLAEVGRAELRDEVAEEEASGQAAAAAGVAVAAAPGVAEATAEDAKAAQTSSTAAQPSAYETSTTFCPLPGEPSPKLRLAAQLFARAQKRIKRQKPSHVLMGVLNESGWLSRLEEGGIEAMAVAANVLKAVRMVEELESVPGYGLARVARDFREQAASTACGPGALSVAEQNAVRIMTIHKSKGLQFPVVAVAAFEPTQITSSAFVSTAGQGRVSAALNRYRHAVGYPTKIDSSFAYQGCDPLTCDDVVERACAIVNYDQREEVAEARRKFYVACTRASEYLLVSGVAKPGAGKDDVQAAYKATPILNDVRAALRNDEDFPFEDCPLTYGGSEPARFERVSVTAEDMGDAPENNTDNQRADTVADQQEDKAAALCSAASTTEAAWLLEQLGPLEALPLAPLRSRKNVFSYSSIAPHEDHLPLAQRDDLSESKESSTPAADTTETADEPVVPATSLGTVFHRLAQIAVLNRERHHGALVCPDKQRIKALADNLSLEQVHRTRLQAALDRWFASEAAHRAQQAAVLQAEVPFMVQLPSPEKGGEPLFMEGEIDLLALDESKTRAFVVDYKTGGSDEESPERLQKKHELQATCYAYALLSEGIQHAEFAFVRVERANPENPQQPQVVSYTFDASQLPQLTRTIQKAYRGTH